MKMLGRRPTFVPLVACLALALVLAARTGNITYPPLSDPHIPGVRQVADLDALQRTYQIQGVATYSEPVTRKTRIVFHADQL
jgi:hypothetical protein